MTLRITDIAKLKGRRHMMQVVFDDGETYDIDPEILLLSRWETDTVVERRDREAIIRQSRLKQAKDLIIDMLGRRMMSEMEIRRKLQAKKIQADAADAAIQDLQRVGLINDREFAERFSRDQIQRNGVGRSRLQRDLMQRGIERDLITTTLDRIFAETDEKALAVALLHKRGFGIELRDDMKRRQRAYALLIRRGFDNETAQDALYDITTIQDS